MAEISNGAAAANSSVTERVGFALRQASVLAVALLVAGLVAERLRPEAIADRGLTTTPFLWAIVVWVAVLLVGALSFERAPMRELEGMPLYGGLVAGGIVFGFGLANLEGDAFARRAAYAFANSLGAIMFWWGLFSLSYLVVRSFDDRPDQSSSSTSPGRHRAVDTEV